MQSPDLETCRYDLATAGSCHFHGVLEPTLVAALRDGIDRMIDEDRALGQSRGSYGYLAHTRGACFVELLERSPLQAFVDDFLAPTCVIHSYNTMRVAPDETSHARHIHRDSPRFSAQYRLAVQILYLLSDFSDDNGATRLLPGSHNAAERPSDDHFWQRSVPVRGVAGDAVLFDSMVWHAGGLNRTRSPRYAITIVYTRSFMKQQFDLPRATPPELAARLSPRSRRLLGYDVRVPTSLAEFLVPDADRLYKAGQG